jgi:NADPH2:quinone reductase
VRAVTVAKAGGPEELVLTEQPDPTPGPGEVLVRTHAAGVNYMDTYQRSGSYAVSYPFIPGGEASGIVEAVGEGVTSVAAGDRVTTGQAKHAYAELFVAAADRVVRVPDGIDLDVAAAFPLQGLTAHYLATSSANPQPGETVLLHAGAGGVGLLLTQLLAARGVRVLTTVSTPEKAELSRQAGAADVFSYDDFKDRAREATGGEGVAVAYDGVGRTTFDDSLASVRVRGQLVLFGAASGPVPPFELQRLAASGSLSVTRPTMGHFLRTEEERAWRYGELLDAISSGRLDVRIGGRYRLADARAAHEALESRGTTGKLILNP